MREQDYGAIAPLGSTQPGPQWTREQYTHGAADVQELLVPYFMVITHSAIAASAVDSSPSAIQITEWPFLWTGLHVGDSAGINPETPDLGFTFSLQDEGGQAQEFMSSRITSRNLFAGGPISLPVPWLFNRGHSIRSDVENLDTGSARTCWITLSGWLVEPGVVGQWERYGLSEFLSTPYGYPLPNLSDRDLVPFWYNVRHASIAASGTNTQNPAFQVGQRPFEWSLLSAAPEAGTSGVRLEINDNRSRQGFSDGRIVSPSFMWHGPIALPVPWRMIQGGAMQTTMENLDTGATRSGRATFGGVLL